MTREVIKSVGIDIGTSTTKLIMSELTLGRVSSHFALPHFEIIDRQVTYESDIISTPLKSEDEIHLQSLINWLQREYNRMGVSLPDIKSGAVIITGETAIKKNADAILHYLAERSGDFVVAIAGASLEGVLAGRGSGAYERSKTQRGVVANVDIGGGTANVVLFQQGKVLETITFHVGGRLVEISSEGEILAVSPSLRPWLDYKGISLKNGMSLSLEQFREVSKQLCHDMLGCLAGKTSIAALQCLVHSSSCETLPEIHEVVISGGVGRLTHELPPARLPEVAIYNDIGPLLASELMEALKRYPFHVAAAAQTTRATVIGAGMQSTKISGATISIQPDQLPLRNIPVVKVQVSQSGQEKQLELEFLKGKELYADHDSLPFAISLGGLPYMPYQQLKELACIFGTLYTRLFPSASVLVVICENDMAKALGQLLRLYSVSAIDVICIDQIVIDHGDYIDIGEPLHDTMVPVVVKTLAFS
ncbi:ethanolamine ammonia-lyase reactivating factor EutA [Neobacillus niacini]|uniref:ethanolamine ammonia-lyase reactivating factor EutA n=1 Tax=Neobacillus niacini TaxID=86668 RepID=UPI0021CB10BB|nr:ethanolamine ammonia-lyase reactivating factor EutA [Neobacillus niacini]MCM3768531.1 ethanolamine ammonia-lyase reactivating factor EutA [Neobacillus niacini]